MPGLARVWNRLCWADVHYSLHPLDIWFTRGTTVWADVQYGLHPLDIWFNRHTTVWADVHYSLYPLDIWFNRGTTVWADVHYGLNCHVIFGPPEIFCPPGPNISGKLKYLVWGD